LNIYRVTIIDPRLMVVVHPVGQRNNIYLCETEEEVKELATEDFIAGRRILPHLQYIVEKLGIITKE